MIERLQDGSDAVEDVAQVDTRQVVGQHGHRDRSLTDQKAQASDDQHRRQRILPLRPSRHLAADLRIGLHCQSNRAFCLGGDKRLAGRAALRAEEFVERKEKQMITLVMRLIN